ncbi:MAG: C4-dicarboxylate ABC transporter substrate-binding protein, partial [Pseudomonadota bacterium]|nr:C4-dicarboxylate ABC transporter substrate-binding protein [Pseudomonadota bacterium]MEC8268859.1 C4-dicarboxylate ABC transporter substrate-binding protein [Pseudomonadota bacterium]
AKYTFRNPEGMYTTAFGLIMNADSYDDLSAAHKKCIDGMTGVDMARRVGKWWDEADELGYVKFAEMGGKVTDASAAEQAYFREKTAGVEAKVLAGISERGVDAAAALDYFRAQLK